MIQTYKCNLCDFRCQANGHFKTRDILASHIQIKHPLDFAEARQRIDSLDKKIDKLRDEMTKVNRGLTNNCTIFYRR